jgi:hypothetical protein
MYKKLKKETPNPVMSLKLQKVPHWRETINKQENAGAMSCNEKACRCVKKTKENCVQKKSVLSLARV